MEHIIINSNKEQNKDIHISFNSIKCEECDYEFCELLLFCKGKNIDKNNL